MKVKFTVTNGTEHNSDFTINTNGIDGVSFVVFLSDGKQYTTSLSWPQANLLAEIINATSAARQDR